MEDVRVLTLLSNPQANADTDLDTRKCTFSQFSSNSAQSTALNISRLEVLRAREEHLQSIKQLSNRAPQIEYLALFDYENLYYGKRVGGEWVLCDEAEFVNF